MFILWFCGLRGAISFSLALGFPSERHELIITTTIIIVLFTILLLGGGIFPLLHVMKTVRNAKIHMGHMSQVSSQLAKVEQNLDNVEVPE